MLRLLFEKKGNAVWMSHLDLMRLFQRAFKRAGLQLKHTQGFNPRPSVSIALPLSVGVQSCCELLDFELEGECPSCKEICARLNEKLVDGVSVRQVYNNGRKIRELALLDVTLTLSYDCDVPEESCEKLETLFDREELPVEKRSKNGFREENIVPMIRALNISQADARTLHIQARICCQNPTLNPMQISAAIDRYMPELKPGFVTCCRIEIFDNHEKVFR